MLPFLAFPLPAGCASDAELAIREEERRIPRWFIKGTFDDFIFTGHARRSSKNIFKRSGKEEVIFGGTLSSSFFPPLFFSLNVTNRVRVYLLNRTRNIVVVEQSWPWHEKRFFLYVGMNILLAEHGTATTTSDIGAAMVRQRSRLSRVSRFSWLTIFP